MRKKEKEKSIEKMFKVDSSLKHVGQNVGHQRYLEENYGKMVRVSTKAEIQKVQRYKHKIQKTQKHKNTKKTQKDKNTKKNKKKTPALS